MADLSSKPDKGEQASAPKQDTREEIVAKLMELRKELDPMLEGEGKSKSKSKDDDDEDDEVDVAIVERVNQIFHDTVAAIPPDPRPDPVYQRATLTTTLEKLKTQIDAALAQAETKTKKAQIEKLKKPFEKAYEDAKKTDEKKGVPPPAGPSQSPLDLQKAHHDDNHRPGRR